MNIRAITAQQTYALRQEILRPGYPLEACKFAEDDDESAMHFGAFSSGILLGIVSVYNVSEPENEAHNNAWQIRAMATHERIRGRGYAAALLKSAETHAKSREGVLIWCNARSSALGFYEKQGYQIVGDAFEIVGVGPHFRMKKVLEKTY